MKKLLIVFVLMIISIFTYAENTLSGKIKGIIVDSETNQPMEYANIAIYNADSTLVTGGISNSTGQFEIKGLNTGDYYAIANFIGYNKITINNIKITSNNQTSDLGKIILSVITQQLNEVNVIADKQRIEYKIDKKVVNVSQDINAAGGTAVNVLENTPSVDVDIEGNVSLRGSSNFIVLIDGKPSVLTGSDALRQIPATAIQNIEIITNPSAKYDPDGSGGIINVVMKQNILSGFNGIINTMVGTSDKYRSDITLNYRTNKSNLFFGADWSDDSNIGKMSSERQTLLGDTTQFIITDGTRNMIRGGLNFKAGADFYLSKKTTLTVSSTLGKYNFDMNGTSYLNEFSIPNNNSLYYTNSSSSNREGNSFSTNISLQHKFNETGTHKLDILTYYSNRNGDEFENQDEFLTDNNFVKNSVINQIKTTSTDNDNNFRFKLDYVKPIGNAKIETGLQAIIEHETEDYKFENFNTKTNSWVNNTLYSSNMDFKNDVYAGYFTYSNQIGKFQYMGGLRAEYTDRYIFNLKSTQPFELQRFDLFPSAHISYNLNESTQLMTSYSKRVRRPDGRDLDPFASYIDQYTIRVGNPDLKPEYTNSYELQLMKRFGTSFISFDGFYRTTNNLMTRTQELHDDGLIYMTTQNINNDYSLGTEVMGNVNITKWLNLNTSVSLYNYQIKGEINNQSIDRESTNYSIRGNATIKLSSTSRVQWMSMFRGPSASAQGETSSMFFSNLSYKQDFLKKKLTATVSVRDIFGTMNMTNKTYSNNYNFTSKMSMQPRIFQITLSYNINNYKTKSVDSIDSGSSNMEIEY